MTLLDGQEKAIAAVKENFEVSLAPSVPRPLIMAKIAAAATGADELLNTGLQLANKGDVAAALPKLAEAHARAPQRPDVAVAYAQALFRSKAIGGRRTSSCPARKRRTPAEVPALLGMACQALENTRRPRSPTRLTSSASAPTSTSSIGSARATTASETARKLSRPGRNRSRSAQPGEDQGPRRVPQEEVATPEAGEEARRYGRTRSRGPSARR